MMTFIILIGYDRKRKAERRRLPDDMFCNLHVSLLSYTFFLETAVLQKSLSCTTHLRGPGSGGGGPSIPYPIIFFKKYPTSFKNFWQLSPNIGKLCIPIFQKLIKVYHIPLIFLKKYPLSL